MPGQQQDNERIPAAVFNAISQVEDRYGRIIEDLRTHLVKQIENLRTMVLANATKDDVERELRRIKDDIAMQFSSVNTEVDGVQTTMKEIVDKVKSVELTVLKKFTEIDEAQKERQTKVLRRIVAVQSAILSPVVIAVIIYILETFIRK